MEQTAFLCKRSALSRCFVVLIHTLFIVYLFSLPLTGLGLLLFPLICLLLMIWEYRKLPKEDFLLVYCGDRGWQYELIESQGMGVGHLTLRLRRSSPLVLVVDICRDDNRKSNCLLIWRDSLSAQQWRKLKVYLTF